MPGLATARRPPPEAEEWPRELPEQTELQETLHANHSEARRQIVLALFPSPFKIDKAAAFQISGCCTSARFFISPSVGKVRPHLNRCRHRLCPYCGQARSNHVAQQLDLLLACMPRPRHMVLTTKAVALPLARQLQDLRSHLAKLRKTKTWRRYVKGGVYAVEITRNPSTGLWHPHLHIIWDGDYFPFKALQYAWHRVTGNSEIVWTADVDSNHAAATEISKYLGKPQHLRELPDFAIREYNQATRGARMIQTFGRTHGVKVKDETPLERLPDDCYSVSIARLVYLAGRGHKASQHLLPLIAERWHQFADYIWHAHPQLTAPVTQADRLHRIVAIATGRQNGPLEPGPRKLSTEELEAKLFIFFTRYRQDDQAGLLDRYDLADPPDDP